MTCGHVTTVKWGSINTRRETTIAQTVPRKHICRSLAQFQRPTVHDVLQTPIRVPVAMLSANVCATRDIPALPVTTVQGVTRVRSSPSAARRYAHNAPLGNTPQKRWPRPRRHVAVVQTIRLHYLPLDSEQRVSAMQGTRGQTVERAYHASLEHTRRCRARPTVCRALLARFLRL